METLKQRFSSRVSAFLGRTGLSPTAFGMKAVGDPNLIRQIDRGRSLSLRTADRVLAFMAEYDGDSGGARDPPRRQGCFPRPVSLGSRAVGWIEAEADEWIRERIEASRGEGA